MNLRETVRQRPFRAAVAFALAITASTGGVFSLLYFHISNVNVGRAEAILADDTAASVNDDEARLRLELETHQSKGVRRLDYVALFGPDATPAFGNVAKLPSIPVDGRAHLVAYRPSPLAQGASEPVIFAARPRPDGRILLLGRSLTQIYVSERPVLDALLIALPAVILFVIAIGAVFARRASMRLGLFDRAIAEVMNGDLSARLPVNPGDDEIDRVAKSVNLMLDEIERLLDQLRSVGDNIAHDIRAPLAAARARIARALDEGAAGEPLRRGLASAVEQLDRASITIAALLRISSVENGPRDKRFRDFDLAEVCRQVFEFYEPLAQARPVSIAVAAPDFTPVRGDKDLMREAISNLVDNAIKFTPAGGRVELAAGTDDLGPYASVADNGPGVPVEERGKIFRRFYRSDPAGPPGSGLGLSIAMMIARLHGFELTVEDNHPGARFTLRAAAKAALVRAGGDGRPAPSVEPSDAPA